MNSTERSSAVIDPVNEIENEDGSEVCVCRHCRTLIEPGRELIWNGWTWCRFCAPLHVLHGDDRQRPATERRLS
jgi:hypothetical protein